MAVAMVVLGSLGTACSDVVVDSIVVERSRGESQVIVNHANNGSGTNDSHSIMKTTVMINKTCISSDNSKSIKPRFSDESDIAWFQGYPAERELVCAGQVCFQSGFTTG